MPFTPIYSPARGEFLADTADRKLDTMRVIAATQHYLDRQGRECEFILRMARATASRHQRVHLAALRMDRKKWISTKKHLCGTIAAGLRSDGIAPG